jgi:hypothetical protein
MKTRKKQRENVRGAIRSLSGASSIPGAVFTNLCTSSTYFGLYSIGGSVLPLDWNWSLVPSLSWGGGLLAVVLSKLILFLLVLRLKPHMHMSREPSL